MARGLRLIVLLAVWIKNSVVASLTIVDNRNYFLLEDKLLKLPEEKVNRSFVKISKVLYRSFFDVTLRIVQHIK